MIQRASSTLSASCEFAGTVVVHITLLFIDRLLRARLVEQLHVSSSEVRVAAALAEACFGRSLWTSSSVRCFNFYNSILHLLHREILEVQLSRVFSA